jgi:hypothetical protein
MPNGKKIMIDKLPSRIWSTDGKRPVWISNPELRDLSKDNKRTNKMPLRTELKKFKTLLKMPWKTGKRTIKSSKTKLLPPRKMLKNKLKLLVSQKIWKLLETILVLNSKLGEA